MLSLGEWIVTGVLLLGAAIPVHRIVSRGPASGTVIFLISVFCVVVVIAGERYGESVRPAPAPIDWRSLLTRQDFVPSHPGDEAKSNEARDARIARLQQSAAEINALEMSRHEQRVRSARATRMAFPLATLLGAGLGFLAGQVSRRRAVVARNPAKTFAEVEGLVAMLMAACDDPDIKSALDRLLELPDLRRKEALRTLIDQLRGKRAPHDLIDAFICLQDDAVAEKAYVAIYQCWNKPGFGGPKLA